ncbi:hypothetical protein C1N83_24385 [Priestia aryabhattai]|uniref:hypothetical protein n=1 Tax=Bacillaceae TaxID=186817 RepID=UPI00064E9333|nr:MULTISPECIES: hypothetical protein [Bacillaceae]KML30727.1 hypothetical protein VL11_06395 [Priestia aryabhattai]KMN99742.1 hypothetical protein ABV89_07610 [Priestia aryabhattai]KZE12855.1 hypothetical protein AVW12_04480 [Priestia aryabhattai]MDE8673883.1 hypothetical protein [Priestia aryabhattai]MEB4869460.1 hypothetical protein [Priestia megaterium]
MKTKIIPVIISSICGSLAFSILFLEGRYIDFTDFIDQFVTGLILIPFVIVFGLPFSIMIDTIIRDTKKYKALFEFLLYVLSGVVGTSIILLIFSLSDGISIFLEFKPFLILALSCSVPFGISSIILKYVFKTVPSH